MKGGGQLNGGFPERGAADRGHRGQGGRHPRQGPAPDEHPSIAGPGHVDLLSVHTEGGEDLQEDGLREGDVVMAGGPVTGVLQVGAVSTGGVAGVVVVEAGVTGLTERSHISGHIPAAPEPSVSHVVHPAHGHVNEAGLVHIGHVPPGHVGHLVMDGPGPAVVVQDERDGVSVGEVVVGGEVEAVLPHHVPQPGVRHRQGEPLVPPQPRQGRHLQPAPGARGRAGDGEEGEERDREEHDGVRQREK